MQTYQNRGHSIRQDEVIGKYAHEERQRKRVDELPCPSAPENDERKGRDKVDDAANSLSLEAPVTDAY